jgi:hypothetical protein
MVDEEAMSDGGDLPDGVRDGVSTGGEEKIDVAGDGVSRGKIDGVSLGKIDGPLTVGRGILAKPFEGVVFAGRVLKVGRKMVDYALLQEKNGVWEYRKMQETERANIIKTFDLPASGAPVKLPDDILRSLGGKVIGDGVSNGDGVSHGDGVSLGDDAAGDHVSPPLPVSPQEFDYIEADDVDVVEDDSALAAMSLRCPPCLLDGELPEPPESASVPGRASRHSMLLAVLLRSLVRIWM